MPRKKMTNAQRLIAKHAREERKRADALNVRRQRDLRSLFNLQYVVVGDSSVSLEFYDDHSVTLEQLNGWSTAFGTRDVSFRARKETGFGGCDCCNPAEARLVIDVCNVTTWPSSEEDKV